MRQADFFLDDRPICPVVVADTWWERARGMTLRRPLPEALVVINAEGAYAFGMRRGLDVALLDEAGTVIRIQVVKAWRTARFRPRGNLLEALHGSFERWGVRPGSRVTIVPH